MSCASPRYRPQWYGHGTPAVGDDKTQRGEILEQVRSQELHERRGVGVNIMRAGGVEIRIAGGTDVHHRGNIQLDHLFVNRIPIAVRQRGSRSMASRGIGIQIAANETELVHAAFQFPDRIGRRHSRRLGQL